MNDANVTAHNEVVEHINRQLTDACNALSEKATKLYSNDMDIWEARGGCKACHGTSTVLTWSTLDGSSYDEFGLCKAEGCTAKTVGMAPGIHSPQGSGWNRGGETPVDYAKRVYAEEMALFVTAYETAKSNHYECIGRELYKQDYIIVLKGRKIPVGEHGVVVGFSNNQWGSKVGFCNAQGTIQWTAISNVARCLGMDGETKKPAIEAYIKSTNEYRKAKGYRPTAATVETLMEK